MDLELLRTFVAVLETGGFGKAGLRRHLTQSAISVQMKRLAEDVGRPLFVAHGRGRAPTPAAELLFGYAGRLLALHDEAVRALVEGSASELVRLGATQDFAEARLPGVLRSFSQSHPQVRLEVRVGRSPELSRLVVEGELDLAVVFQAAPSGATPFARERGAWLAAPGFKPPLNAEPWPLALLEAPCVFREAALRTLDEARLPWRIVYSTPSLGGLLAAVRAGLAVTLRLARHSQKGLRSLPPSVGLPAPPRFLLTLLTAEELTAGARTLAAALRTAASDERAARGGRKRRG
jgi:DNA-binding transcriptional LysR family regulator